ncbi:MAG: SRPBCC domain-containing protein [Saprospiraceae bacterium]
MKNNITIRITIQAESQKVWDYYTNPLHIIHWNFADPSWHCPTSSNDMVVGGTYKSRMEARDGSFGFDFEAIYTEIIEGKEFTYLFGGRTAKIIFNDLGSTTDVVIDFEAEDENPIEMQKNGWQAILDNFKKYVESN